MSGKIVMMIGIQGSGKSTYARDVFNYKPKDMDVEILSSDEIRREIFGDAPYEEIMSKNHIVFDKLNNRVKKLSDNGVNVIIDATNISSKRRKSFCERFKNYDKMAVYISESLSTCIARNKVRHLKGGHNVPKGEIERTFKNLQVPVYSEGWDNIQIICSQDVDFDYTYWEDIIYDKSIYKDHDKLFSLLSDLKPFSKIKDLPQDNSNHSFSVSRHTFEVFNYVAENYNSEDRIDDLVMRWTALFHDTGKFDTKSFTKYNGKPSRYASFIGHENVSGFYACNYLYAMGYNTNFVLRVVEMVNNHMKLLKAKGSEKSIKRLKNQVGEDVFRKLEFFREADTSGK